MAADSDAAVRNILGDNTSGSDCGTFPYRHSRQDDRTASDPGVVLDRNRLGDGDAGIPAPRQTSFLRNDRMCSRVDLHIRGNQHIAADTSKHLLEYSILPRRIRIADSIESPHQPPRRDG